jgi:2-oxoglutarate decarboxylase
VLAELGIGKVVTLTSTYDHRIIQGAESGLFLAHVAECLTGPARLLRRGLRVHGRPLRAGALAGGQQRRRRHREGEHQRLIKQVHVQTLINMYRVRGHLIAHLDPLDAEPPDIHPELDPLTTG